MMTLSRSKRDTVEKLFLSLIGVQMLSFISLIISNVIDAIAIKRCLGTDALAAYSFSNTVISIEMAAFGFLMQGVSVLLSRNAGEQDAGKRNSAFSTAILLALAVGAVLTVMFIGASYMMADVVGTPAHLRDLSASYIRGNALGIIPYLLFAVFSASTIIEGGKRQLMLSFVVMAATDIVLDFLNGYVLGFGIWGMGAATAASEFVAFAVVVVFYLRGRKLFRFVPGLFDKVYAKDTFEYGYMYVVKQLMLTVLGYVYNNYITFKYGSNVLAVYAAAFSALSLLQCLSSAIGNTVSTLTGFYAKEEDGTSLKSMMRASVKYSGILNAAIIIVSISVAGPVMRMFYKANDEFFVTAVEAFRLFSLSIVFRSINMAIRGYYQSMKMQVHNMLFTFVETLVCEVLSLIVLCEVLGMSGIWLSFVAGEMLALLLLTVVLMIGRGTKDCLDAWMCLPPTWSGKCAERFVSSCHSADEIMACSEAICDFFHRNGASDRTSNVLSLAVEEIGRNTVQYGFIDGRGHSIDIRAKRIDGAWMLIFHDDCMGFDPTKYLIPSDSGGEHNGIRMVSGLVSEMTYANALGINNLFIQIKDENNAPL
ncbi:MAG: hypothetical protein J5910_00205 [Lachnospiraceae bacterium]|nr:hypothetical protein [Lachnospiraceae bacterium]